MLGSAIVKMTKEELEKLTKEQLIDMCLSIHKTQKDLLDMIFECEYETFLKVKTYYKFIKDFN